MLYAFLEMARVRFRESIVLLETDYRNVVIEIESKITSKSIEHAPFEFWPILNFLKNKGFEQILGKGCDFSSILCH